MRIITVSGAHSGVGKTKIVEALLRKLKGWSALKTTLLHQGLCPTGRNCGACHNVNRRLLHPFGARNDDKRILQRSKFSIIADSDKLNEAGKDTQRYKKAGASKVLWLKAKPQGLGQGLRMAIDKFQGAKGLIIEGNSILKYINPDLAIFVKRKNSALKVSAQEALKKADLIMTL